MFRRLQQGRDFFPSYDYSVILLLLLKTIEESCLFCCHRGSWIDACCGHCLCIEGSQKIDRHSVSAKPPLILTRFENDRHSIVVNS